MLRTQHTKLNCSSSSTIVFLMLCNTQTRLQECHEHNLNHLPLQCGLQDKNQHINDMFNKIKALGNKLQLWEFQLHWNNPAHISIRRTEKPTDAEKHADIYLIQLVQHEFNSQFQILQKTWGNCQLFPIISWCEHQNSSRWIQLELHTHSVLTPYKLNFTLLRLLFALQ